MSVQLDRSPYQSRSDSFESCDSVWDKAYIRNRRDTGSKLKVCSKLTDYDQNLLKLKMGIDK